MSTVQEIEAAAKKLPAAELATLVERLRGLLREPPSERPIRMPDFEARLAEYCQGPPMSAEASQALLDDLRGDR